MNPLAVILDMDGLMIDSERLYFQAQEELARRYGKRVDESVLWRMMGHKPLESMDIFKRELGLTVPAADILEERNRLMRVKLQRDLRAMPGLFSMLDTISGKMKLAVATGAQGEFLDTVVQRLGIRDYFDVLQSSDGLARGKPDPAIYLSVCARLRLEPGRCVAVEDSANGVAAARRAGCHVVAVPSDYTEKQDFSRADARLANLFEATLYILKME